MITLKRRQLIEDLEQLLKAPAEFGFIPEAAPPTLAQCLEGLISLPVWSWLSRDELVEEIARSKSITIEGGCVVHRSESPTDAKQRSDFSAPPPSLLYFPDPSIPESRPKEFVEIYPESLWIEQLHRRREQSASRWTRLYRSQMVALRVSWSLVGDLQQAYVRTVSRVDQSLSRRTACDGEIWPLSAPLSPPVNLGPPELPRELWRDIQLDVWLNESLYLDEPGAQGLAAKKLYKMLPQGDIEALLLDHLFDPDPEVRVNVLASLGLPTYRVGFAPGAQLPERSTRLEHVVLRVQTVRKMLDLAHGERDQDVLDNLVCTLSAQSFSGSLSPLARPTKDLLVELIPRLLSEQSTRDANFILRGLHRQLRQGD